jgi:ketosteroid isomerase-like protein
MIRRPADPGIDTPPAMKPSVLLAAFCAACAASAAVWAQPLPTVTLPPDVDRVLHDYARAWQANDTAALSQLFTTDGLALPSGKPPAQGADSIRKAYSPGAGTPLHLRPIAFGASGELAYVIGGWGSAAEKPDYGKFTLVLRRQADGRWLIVSDMDNANAPSRPVPPPASPPGS